MSHFTDEQGKKAVETARAVIEGFIQGGAPAAIDLPDMFNEKGGVFVTIKKYPGEELRGCIGYPEPVAPLKEALTESAISAATRDPRFHPLAESELSQITIEVSLLTTPQPIDVKDSDELLQKVKIGEDGLIIERGRAKGLLLPQVPVEWNWDVREFLENTCGKAGLPQDAWRDRETRFFKFQAEIFSETMPGGTIERKMLDERLGCDH